MEKIKQLPETRGGGKNISLDIAIDFVNEFLQIQGLEYSVSPQEAVINIDWGVQNALTRSVSDATIENIELSEKESHYFNALISIGTMESDQSDIVREITNLENRIIKDSELSSEESDRLLNLVVVCKYSFQYWASNIIDWYETITGEEYYAESGNSTRSEPDPKPEDLKEEGKDANDDKKATEDDGKGFWGNLLDAAWKTAVADGSGALVGAGVAGPAGAAGGALSGSVGYCVGKLL